MSSMLYALTPLLAHTGGWHDGNGWHDGHWWIVFPILWLLLAALAVAYFARRSHHAHDCGDPARRILGERFARGEISADEYRDRLSQLR
jgi:putative membrane protein